MEALEGVVKVLCLAIWLGTCAITGVAFWAQWSTYLNWSWYETMNQVIFLVTGIVFDLALLALLGLAGLMLRDLWASS